MRVVLLIAQTLLGRESSVKNVRVDRRWPRSKCGDARTDLTPYGSCGCEAILRGSTASHATQGTADTSRGGQSCAESKQYSQLQHCSRDWPLRRRRMRKFPSASAFNPSVLTATTTTHPTPARPMASTGRDTSTAASSWAWARGPAGAMATAGVIIALSAKAAEAITAAADMQPITATLPAAAEYAAERQFAPTAPTVRIQATHMLRS